MLKYSLFILFSIFSTNVFSNDSLLTIQQQLERLQRDVSDLSKIIYLDDNSSSKNNNDLVTNLSAIDMRIYDLEKDVKNLTSNIEDILFQIEDLMLRINVFEENIKLLENNLLEVKKNSTKNNDQINIDTSLDKDENENTLGSLNITKEADIENLEQDIENQSELKEKNLQIVENLSPEDQFQVAFDNIRDKNWRVAKELFEIFIEENPTNQLSGSAYYWLGELYILDKAYREAAITFAEGYQKFPDSIKSPDMLLKLSQSLFEVNKVNESCKTLEKLILDYPKYRQITNANKQMIEYNCLELNE